MPRKSAVTPVEIIPILEKNGFFSFKPATSDIWIKISEELGFKWTSHTVYTNVRENIEIF